MEGVYKNSENGCCEIFKRELGVCRPGLFSRRISASQPVIEKIDSFGKLTGHQGCVNTVAFNSTGELIVSGSDDKQIKLWDWTTQKLKLSYPSGHFDNVFQARIIPSTDNRKIVTSSADCQVRLGLVLENGSVETQRLSKHQGRVHKLAVEPGSPYIFYSCGEDGFVQHYDLRSNSATKIFFCTAFAESSRCSNTVALHSIVIDPRNPNYIAVGGADVYARVYDIRKYQFNASTRAGSPFNSFCVHHLIRTDKARITALAYSNSSELLVSYNDELIYLFQKDMGLGPDPLSSASESSHNSRDAQVYKGHRNSLTVKGVNFFGPNDDYVLSGSDCGYIFIWKKKGGALVRSMVGDSEILNQLEPHPFNPVLATCGIDKNIRLWAPCSNTSRPLPDNILQVMENNRLGRENNSRSEISEDVMIEVMNWYRQIYERRDNGRDDEDEWGPYGLGYSGYDGTNGGNPRDQCNIG